jgi:alkanesulfonate monooxygenase SsuD/methylene tetrahydromethanopterin reductase-like flavin-dependent oxidoreductase (luciferase family)
MTTVRLGFTFPPTLAPERLKFAALAAEAAGLDEFWVWEDCFKESGIACAAAVLGWTSRISTGIGLLPVPLRNVAVTAMEIATLDRLFPGRFYAGIGHGVQEWMGQAGAKAESPMTLLREHVVALRKLLAGECVSTQGRYVKLDHVVLDWPPLNPPALLIGGAGPRSLELATELGDGVLLTGNQTHAEVIEQVSVIRRMFEALGEAGLVAGKSKAVVAPDITTTQIASTGAGAQRRVNDEAAAWDQEAIGGVAVAGGAAEIAESVDRLVQLGITAVTIMPARDEPDLEALIGVLGQARELLHAS